MNILLVEDDKDQRAALADFLRSRGYTVFESDSIKNIDLKHTFALALVDLRLPDGTGIDVLKLLKKNDPDIPVILITAYGTVDTAVEAMKEGAYDYILKPIDLGRLMLTIERAIEKRNMVQEIRMLKEEITRHQKAEDIEIVAESEEMKQVLSLVKRVAPTDTTVLITGESGTGKELVAKLIHELSGRRGLFVPVSISALPDTLIEAELFGYEKGAFTGATVSKPGRFELADEGTLFLDEIGELSLAIQVKLLRVLQERVVERLGSTHPKKVNVRIVAATNRDLESLVKKGEFREDLFYRLNVIIIHIPPLRERKKDIIPLAEYFLKKYSKSLNKPVVGISEEARFMLLRYAWHGNVRELENVIERAIVLTRHNVIMPQDLPENISGIKQEVISHGETGVPTLDELEKQHIENVLRITQGNLSRAAKILGIHRNTLRLKLKKYGIEA